MWVQALGKMMDVVFYLFSMSPFKYNKSPGIFMERSNATKL